MVAEPVVYQYPALKHLIVANCEFKFPYAVSAAESTGSFVVRYQADLLHTTLRGCPSLEYLEVTIDWLDEMPARTRYDLPIVMHSLKTAILPPPAMWPLDIVTPNLEFLAFRLPSDRNPWRHEGFVSRERLSMIPDIGDTTFSETLIQTLKSADFACCSQDNSSRLETWLTQLHSIVRLGVCNDSESPYPKPPVAYEDLADHAAYHVFGILKDHPEYCPALVELHFEGCLSSGKTIIEYIRLRRQTTGCAVIQRLVLKRCKVLSAKAKRTLAREVADCSIIQECTAPKYIVKRYIDDDFESENLEEE
jgi:hypothetical protein